MLARLPEWLDHRTGYRKLIAALLIEHIPGGAKWRYVWGSCLMFVFGVQLITGVLLMTAYSPSDSTAWSSVYFIQYQMDFGWLIRGLHHFGSQTMVVLLGIHILQVVIAGAHLPPREVNWWLGLALLGAVLILSLTGYLLPWDQKGYWATQVATNIAGNLPVAGSWLQKIIVGGPVYGHHTLTRFYALHVGIIPPLMIALIIAHLTAFRRHGVTCSARVVSNDISGESHSSRSDGWFWPDQAFRDMVASMVIFGIMLGLVVYGHGHKVEALADADRTLYDRLAHAGVDGKGADLDAPADPSRAYPARPEWYFLSLFQLLKYFEGEQEIIGTVIIPNGLLVLLALLPLLGYGRMRKFGHGLGVLAICGLLIGVAILTCLAIAEDRADPSKSQKAKLFQDELKEADERADRAIQLAYEGIPAEGPVLILRRDPLTKGKTMFGHNCATCHTHGNDFDNKKPTASDLAGFGTKEWIRGLLGNPGSPEYFGHTKLRRMKSWVETTRNRAHEDHKEDALDAEFDLIAGWLAGHPGRDVAQEKEPAFLQGLKAFEKRCNRCHSYKGEGGASSPPGPDFTGYGDADWIRLMIMAPSHPLRYGIRNRMPAFRDLEGPTAEMAKLEIQQIKDILNKNVGENAPEKERKKKEKEINQAVKLIHLSDIDRELIIRYLLKDYRVVFGGEPISGPPK
jgi:ubiquinol-cytochrome c reductase cytochrome b subunit